MHRDWRLGLLPTGEAPPHVVCRVVDAARVFRESHGLEALVVVDGVAPGEQVVLQCSVALRTVEVKRRIVQEITQGQTLRRKLAAQGEAACLEQGRTYLAMQTEPAPRQLLQWLPRPRLNCISKVHDG